MKIQKPAPIYLIWKTENASNAFTLTFEGGVEVNVIEGHGFYDADKGSWLELKSCKRLNKCISTICPRSVKVLANIFEYDSQLKFAEPAFSGSSRYAVLALA